MNIHDYLIDLKALDPGRLLEYWRASLPERATLWFVNRLGEPFLTGSDGAIHWLVVGTGALARVAPDRQAFASMLDQADTANEWLRIPLIDASRRAGMQLGPEECYGFKIPPPLLGRYEVSNLQPTNIYSHYSWLAHITRQDEIYWTGD
jgi:hypothetical protein